MASPKHKAGEESTRYSGSDSVRRSRLAGLGRLSPYCILVVAALNVAFWFPSGAPIGWGDTGLLMYGANPSIFLHAATAPWNGLMQLGMRSAASMTLLPLAVYFYVVRHAGVSPAVAEGAYFFAIQLTGMLAVYAVAKKLGAERVSCQGALAAALFYNFAPLTFENYWMIGNSSVILIALAPLVVLVAIRLPETGFVRGAGEVILVEYFCFAGFQDPAYFLPVLTLSVVLAILAVLRINGSPARMVLTFVSVALAGAAAAAWYVLPYLLQLNSFFQQATAEIKPAVYLSAADQNVNLHSLVEFRAFRSGSPAFAPYWSPSWRLLYGSAGFQAIGLLLLGVVVVAALLGIWRHDWRVVGLIVTGLIGLLLCLGGNPPTGSLYLWAFKHVPYFAAFRNPANKWTPWLLLPSAMLFAYGVSQLLRSIKGAASFRRRRPGSRHVLQVAAGALICLVVVGYGFPMFGGGPGNPKIRSQTFVLKPGVRAPPSFLDVRDFFARQRGWFRVLVVPLSLNGYRWFKWPQGYDGPDLSWLQFGVPTVSSPYSQPMGDGGRFLFSMANLAPEKILRVAERIGCRYVLAEGDAVGTGVSYFARPRPSAAEFVAAAQQLGGQTVLRRGSLTVVSMPKKKTAPLVSVLSLTRHRYAGRVAGLATDNQSSARAVLTLSQGVDLVVFREAYDSQWHLTLTRLDHGAGRVVVERHVVVNGYGNAWLVRVPRQKRLEKVSATFTYGAAALEDLGALISVVTVAGLLVAAIATRLRRSSGLTLAALPRITR